MTTEQKTAILHDSESGRTVQLSADYHHTVELTTVTFANSDFHNGLWARFHFLRGERKSKQFRLTGEEMDALTTEWTTYKADQQAKKEAEQAAERQAIEDALALAATCPLLTIEEMPGYDKTVWKLSADTLSIHFYHLAFDSGDLAEQIGTVLKAYEPYKAAMDILKECKAIHVKKDGSAWFVSVPHPALYGQWAHTTGELLRCVQNAKEVYDEHMAKQKQAEVA